MQPMTVPGGPPKKGKAGLVIGIGLIVAGIALGILLAVAGVRGAVDTVNDYQRVSMATGGTITIDDPGTYRIFLEYPGADDELADRPGGFVTVEGPGGPVAVLPEGHSETYSFGGHTGRLLGKFHADTAGTYTLRTMSRDGAVSFGEVAVGKKGPLGAVAAVVGGILLGGLLVVIGVIVLIVRAVRSSRRNAPPPAYGWGAGEAAPPLPGWGPGAGPAPPGAWGAPGQAWGPPGAAPGQPWTPPGAAPGPTWTPGPGPAAPPPPAGPVWNPPPSPPASAPDPSRPPWGDAPPSAP